jgi:hypothetical protein
MELKTFKEHINEDQQLNEFLAALKAGFSAIGGLKGAGKVVGAAKGAAGNQDGGAESAVELKNREIERQLGGQQSTIGTVQARASAPVAAPSVAKTSVSGGNSNLQAQQRQNTALLYGQASTVQGNYQTKSARPGAY